MQPVKNEQGYALVFVTLMIVLLLIMVGMGLDTGHLAYVRSQGHSRPWTRRLWRPLRQSQVEAGRRLQTERRSLIPAGLIRALETIISPVLRIKLLKRT